MAGIATSGHRRIGGGVIEHRTAERRGAAVAGIALRGGGNMVGRFSQGVDRDITTAMASGAIAGSEWPGSAGMTHRRRHKIRGVSMAGIALRGGWDMRAGLGFNTRGHAMAGIATSGHRRIGGGVIEHRTAERRGAAVAGIALRGGGNMVGRFSQGVDRNISCRYGR